MRTALALAAVLALPALAAGQVPLDTSRPLAERGCCLDRVENGVPVESFEIRGNSALRDETIENAIYTEEEGFFPWSSAVPFDKEEFLKDLRRLYVLYHRHGYFGLELESYEVRPEGDGVAVTITVREGEPTRVETLSIEGLEEVEAEAGALPTVDELLEAMPLDRDEVFNEPDLLASRDTLETILQNRGFAYARVLLEYRIVKDERRATVTYTIDPGDRYWFGDVRIEGTGQLDQDLVRRQLRFRRGDPYQLSAIRESQRRIYELALFRRVDLTTELAAPDADTLDVSVRVVPAPTHVVRVGVGFGTEDLLRVSGSWLDRSLFGGGRQLEVRGQYSQLDREAATTYRQPSFLVSGLDFATTAFLRFEDEINYTVERAGATARFGYRASSRLSASAGVTVERDNFSEFDAGVLVPELGRAFINPSELLFTDLGVSWDGTDSLFMPSRGSRVNASYQLGVPVFGDYAYHRLTLQVTRYVSIRRGWVLAGKVLPGAIFTYAGEDSRVPLFQRLFAGGATSVRGYERRQLGPKDDPARFGQERNPEPVGGRGLLEASLELRFPVRGSLRGAAFLDAGNVWVTPNGISPSDLKYAPGAGIRYVTPIGPIRLDVARRLSDDEPFLPRWVFHISIGNAF